MSIIQECRVIRPKDRASAVLATVEILFDSGIRLVNMHLLRPRGEQRGIRLKMPSVTTTQEKIIRAYMPVSQETRKAMFHAAEQTLAEAVAMDVNDHTKLFEPLAEGEEPRVPEFSNLRLHHFPVNENPVRAIFSVTVDKEILLNRMVIVRDPETQMFTVRLPKFAMQGGRRWTRYFRMSAAAYDELYNLAMEAYFNPPAEPESTEEAKAEAPAGEPVEQAS